MKIIFFLSFFTFLISCNFSKPEVYKDSEGVKLLVDNKKSNEGLKELPVEDYFSFNLQYANSENNKIEEKGRANLETIQTEFKNFPWGEELEKILLGKGKTSPTFSIVDHLSKKTYAVSIIGYDGKDNEFWMFLITEDGTITKKGKTIEDVYNAIAPFCNRKMEDFEKILNKPEKEFKYTN